MELNYSEMKRQKLLPMSSCGPVCPEYVKEEEILEKTSALHIAVSGRRSFVEVDVPLSDLVGSLARVHDHRVCVVSYVLTYQIHPYNDRKQCTYLPDTSLQ